MEEIKAREALVGDAGASAATDAAAGKPARKK
jgi:hypothetical protein